MGILSTTVAPVCLRGGSEAIRRNGHASNGAQRARCLECGRTFILQPRGGRSDPRFKEQVVAASEDRMSLRGITRTFGVCRKTIWRRVGEKSGESARLHGHALARAKS